MQVKKIRKCPTMFPSVKVSRRSISAQLVLFILLLLPASGWATQWKTYYNRDLGVAFYYPANYVLKEFQDGEGALIGLLLGENVPGGDNWVMNVSFEDINAYKDSEIYDRDNKRMFVPGPFSLSSFAVDMARLQCDSDGIEGTAWCPEAVDLKPYSTAYGLKGYEFFLSRITESQEDDAKSRKKEKMSKGPFYAFGIPYRGSTRVFLAEPADPDDKARMDTFKKIINSLRTVSAPGK